MTSPFLSISQLSFHVPGESTLIFNHLSLEISEGEIVAILGPSGSGKSSLLRIICGLTPPSSGTVQLQGKDITHVAPHRRNIGMVFQGTFLFPHLTVSGNIAYGLKMRKDSKESQELRVEEMLNLVHLSNFSERDIAHLSGGETTRVAIARALAPAPSLLLLDEPLTGLDEHLRIDLAKDLRTALTASGITAILVTHDRNEAATIADRVVQFSELISPS
ncbi:MAG: ABC transporter ATP-binding protein [Ilumatobacteraceae bacterium]|nr:ABC transporter ATP-binding protein [Ilumatobacteraceae bacterium]